MLSSILLLVSLIAIYTPAPAYAWGWDYIECELTSSHSNSTTDRLITIRFKDGHYQQFDVESQTWGPNLCQDDRTIEINNLSCQISREEVELIYTDGSQFSTRHQISISRYTGVYTDTQTHGFYGNFDGGGFAPTNRQCINSSDPLAGQRRRF